MKLAYYIGTKNPDNNNYLFQKAERIDLFEGETVMYRGKLVDADNIEAVFNDLVNTFTVPASPKNSKIFKNWFEIGIKDGFNPNLRVDSYIEYNTLPFRSGKTQLEEIKNKDGKLNSYAITFYGELTGLDDVFDGDKLRDLDFSKYNFEYNRRNISALFTTPTLVLTEDGLSSVPSLIMPMIIPAGREIQYNTSIDNDPKDITKTEGKLFLQDLRPAIRQYRIIEAIEAKYGVIFSRDFLDTTNFTTLYTWLSGNDDGNSILKWEPITASPVASLEYLTFSGNDINFNFNSQDLTNEVGSNPLNESYQIRLRYTFWFQFPQDKFFRIRIVNREGNVLQESGEFEGQGFSPIIGNNGFFSIIFDIFFNMVPNSNDVIDQTFVIEIKSKDKINFADGNKYYSTYFTTFKRTWFTGAGTISGATGAGSTQSIIDLKPIFTISDNMPDITVLDYLKNLIKEFKLIIRPNSTTNFRLQNINDYYAEGNVIDITKYSDQESEQSTVYKNNKTIEYKYAVEEDSILQKNFKAVTGRFRGNDLKTFPVDNKKSTTIEFKNEIPFFVRLKNTAESIPSNINIAIYSKVNGSEIDSIFPDNMLSFYYNGVTPITNGESPEPILLDLNEKPTDDFTPTPDILELTGVPICDSSNNYVSSQVSNNLDFSQTTINGWHYQNLLKNIYKQNHEPWINNLLNSDSRLVTLESVLPPSIVNKIDLNSQIIYKNNKYSIEEFDIDLTTNDTTFTLFPDFNNQFLVSGVNINITNFVFNAGGGFSNIVIRTDKVITEVNTNSSFINVGGIVGNRRVYNIPFYVSENYKDAERNGIINLLIDGINYGVSINQSLRVGSLNNTQLTISPTSRLLDSSEQEFTVNVQSNGFWTIGDLPENIELLSNDLGFGNETSVFKITENTTGSVIEDSFIIFPLTEQSFREFTIRQEA
jgi:hypothetical protein